MKRLLFLASCLCAPFILLPAGPAFLTGKVADPSGRAIGGARIVAAGRLGTLRETASGMDGGFRLPAGGAGEKLIVSAPGFAVKTLPLDSESEAQPLAISLDLAPVNDAITVSASLLEAPLSEQGSSITVISRPEIEQRNEAFALDLLRLVPGVTLNQNGGRGGAAAMFVRGGDSKFNLVLLDGVPVNDVRFGGYFDFAHVPTDNLDRIEVSRGPQSAVFGSYANSSVINLVTRLGDAPPSLSVLAEGGSFSTRRFAVGASGSAQGFRGSVYASRFDTDGEVRNADYRNENVTVGAGKRFRHQDLSFHGTFNSSANGVPGAYGSNPVGNYSGLPGEP